jgi:signal transduction histidine kinase
VADYDLARRLAHEIEPSLVSLYSRLRSLEKHSACRDEALACLSEVEALRSLVRDLLLLGTRPVYLRTFALEALFQRLAHRFGPIAAERGIALGFEAGPEHVKADRSRTERILSNLLDNALKFSPEGSRVQVRSRELDESVEVLVMDAGTGIPAADQERVFQPFIRLDPEKPGVGLGLAIAREEAEAQGGRLSLSSEPGRGSTFTLTLRKA